MSNSLSLEERANLYKPDQEYDVSDMPEFGTPEWEEIVGFFDKDNVANRFWKSYRREEDENLVIFKNAIKGFYPYEPDGVAGSKGFDIDNAVQALSAWISKEEFVEFSFELLTENYIYLFEEYFVRWMVPKMTNCPRHLEIAEFIVNDNRISYEKTADCFFGNEREWNKIMTVRTANNPEARFSKNCQRIIEIDKMFGDGKGYDIFEDTLTK